MAKPATDGQCECIYLASMDHTLYSLNPETGEVSKKYVGRSNELKQYDIAKGEKLKEGEKLELDFKIEMPSTWSNKKKNKIKHWRLELHFKQKTAMVASRGSDKDDATCVLPVKGSKLPPSFGELPKKEKKEKDSDKKKKKD